MDRRAACDVLLQLLHLRLVTIGRTRASVHVTPHEIVTYLDIDPVDVREILAELHWAGWIAAYERVQDGLIRTTYIITDEGRHQALMARIANRELGFDL